MNISNRTVVVSAVALIGLVVANNLLSPVANVPNRATSDTSSGPFERHESPLLDRYTAKVSRETPNPFTPKDPVRTRTSLVYGPTPVPGAIICENHDIVALMIDLYKAHFKEQIENQVIGNQMNLIRGTPSPVPDLRENGCVLVEAGTILDRIKSFGPAVQVEGYDAAGKRVEGITDFIMVEDAAVSESKVGP